MKRIGVVERSGRGVDKIYRGMLRFGRPEPDYRRTDATSVILRLVTTDADEAFLKRVVEEEGRRGSTLPTDSLIAPAALRDLKRLTTEELAIHIQREPAQAKRTLEALVKLALRKPMARRVAAPIRSRPAFIRPKGVRLLIRRRWVLVIFSMSRWC